MNPIAASRAGRSGVVAVVRRSLAALALAGAVVLSGACSRSESPSLGASGASGVAPEPEAPAPIAREAAPEVAAASGVVEGAEPPLNRRASFLEPVGRPMSPSMAVAVSWLEALRGRDDDALARATRYPFTWRQTSPSSCSAKQPAATAAEFSPIVGCLLADASLRRALIEHERAGVTDLPSDPLQGWAKAWRGQAPAGAQLVNAFIVRRDMQVDLNLWVKEGAVQALWTHVVDRTSEVALARRWLEALQKRDLAALAAATSYPFEVRDAGLEAPCGSRSAADRAALDWAARCLLGNDELIRALSSRAPMVEAASEDAPMPDWAEHWWQASRHRGLRKVSAGVSHPSGYSFDLVLMVAPEGVRAAWMRGSLEARD